MVYSAGLAVGPVVAGWLREGVGYGVMNAVVAALCAVVGRVCWVYLGAKPRVLKEVEGCEDGEEVEE